MAEDLTRDPPAGTPFTGRPLPVYVFYPADRSLVTDDDGNLTCERAVYPLDPVFDLLKYVFGVGEVSSSAYEAVGLDGACQEAPPSTDGPFPLLVFSPGLTATNYLYVGLGTRLASHGIVVVVPTHTGDGHWSGIWPSDPPSVIDYNRPRDMSFILDQILERNDTDDDLLEGTVATDQIAAGGMSWGGYATYAVAGGHDATNTLPDPRFRAIVTWDGSDQNHSNEELARITVPTMIIGEDCENVGFWHIRAHAANSAHPNYRVDINETLHRPHYTNLCEHFAIFGIPYIDCERSTPDGDGGCLAGSGCLIPYWEGERLAEQYTIAFLRTYLANDQGYRQILTPGWATTHEENIEFFVSEPGNIHAYENTGLLSYTCKEPEDEPGPVVIGPPPALICHNGHQMTVQRAALAGHLAQGDTLGLCPEYCESVPLGGEPSVEPANGGLGSATGEAVATGTTVDSGDYFEGTCGENNSGDVVFHWTAPSSGVYTFHTLGSDFDAFLIAMDPTTCAEVGCNDDGGGLPDNQALLRKEMEAGQDLLIVVTGWDGAEGNFVLNILAE